MTVPLSDAWFDGLRGALVDLEGPDSLVGTLQVEVAGGTGGDVVLHLEFAGGRVTGAGPGPAPDADATVTLTEDDARGVLEGRLDASVAFMQGRLKVVGDMATVLDVLALSSSAAAKTCLGRIAGLTGPAGA